MALELPDAAAPALRADPSVIAMVPDGVATFANYQTYPPWGLDRVDQSYLPLNSTYDYYYDGSGVTIYIIDTGINPSHTDFGGRASAGFDVGGGTGLDCNGHGTHVAGTAGGSTYGVAKGAQIVGVRVYRDCGPSTTYSDIIAGVDWVTNNRAARSVANISIGGPQNTELNAHVENSIAAGVTYAIAAGNCVVSSGHCIDGPYDACVRSPSGASGAVVVAATDSYDQFAYFSNYGTCVTLNAPGVGIRSAWIGSNTATSVLDGTSMSSPHVAGAAALYLQINGGATPAQVKSALAANATYGVTGVLPAGTPNLLLFTQPFRSVITGTSRMYYATQCTFYASASGGTAPYTYSWSFSSYGGSAGGYSPSNGTYVLVGETNANYTINLKVVATDANGILSTVTKAVEVSTAAWGCG
jgi:subtilisin family serine protease